MDLGLKSAPQLYNVSVLRLRVSVGSQRLVLVITVSRVEELRPHEEVVPSYLEEIKEAFRRSIYQRNPIIADLKSGVILDGTHRWAAMRALGYKWIAVCKVDYLNPSVLLDRWARRYEVRGRFEPSSLLRGFSYEPVEPEEVGKRDLAVVYPGRAYKVEYKDLADAYAKLRVLEWRMAALSTLGPTYVPGDLAPQEVKGGLVLLPPTPLKHEILELARRGVLLPPKSTRHIVPARPLGVNVPLKLLAREQVNLELLNELLRQRRPVLLRAPVSLDREYREVVLYFM